MTQKNRHLRTIAQVCRAESSQPKHDCIDNRKKKLFKQQYLPHVSSQYGALRPTIAAEIGSVAWGTPSNFNGFRVLAALLYGTISGRQPNCGVEQRAPPIFGRAAITLGIGPHF